MFVGSDRVGVVDSLVGVFDRVVGGGGAGLVVLSAPTGFGKTRVVQEFFARVSAAQPVPAYWPARLEGDSSQRWTLTRKCVFPAVVDVPAGAVMGWMWWGVSCSLRQDRTPTQALFDDATQLAAHGGSLLERLSAGDVAGRSVDGTSALVGALGLLGVMLAPPVALGVSVVGGLRTLWQNKDLLGAVTKWRADRDAAKTGFRLDADGHGREQQIRVLGDNIVKMSQQVPVVLVIDDAHWADSTLVEFVDQVMSAPRVRVMIVATTWPTHDELNPFQEWFNQFGPAHPDRCEMVALQRFEEHDLDALIQSEYSAIAPVGAAQLPADVVARVGEICGVTPMGVRAVFGLERTQRLIQQQHLTIDEITRLPRDLEDALRKYWDEIPQTVQTVLAMAAVAGIRFLPAPIIAAATAQGITDATHRLGQGQHPYSFVRGIEADLAAFVDPIFYDAAQRAAQDTFTSAEYQIIREALVDYALIVSLEDSTQAVCEAAWSAHVMLAKEGFTNTTNAAQSALNLAHLAANKFDYTTAIQQTQLSLDWTPSEQVDHPDTLNARANLANWIGEMGRVDDAIAMFEAVLIDQTRVLGPDHPSNLVTRHNLAGWLGKYGRVDDAITMLEALFIDEVRILGVGHLYVLTTASTVAHWYGEVGNVDGAITMLEAILDIELRGLGSDHPNTLATRNNLATWLSDVGRADEAITMLEAVLADRTRVLGPDHPDTLNTRHNLACSVALASRGGEAITMLEAVLADQLRVLGQDHPDTLTSLNSLANRFGEVGRVDDAIGNLEAVVIARTRVLGPDHPDTLNTRYNLAVWLGRADRTDEAITVLEAVLADQLRVLGQDHPDTLTSLNSLANRFGEVGRVDDAIGNLEAVVIARTRVLGPDHPDTLNTRYNLADWLGRADRTDEAITMSQALLADSARILGADHGDTLDARNSLAILIGQTGRIDDAITMSQVLLTDQVRVLGADHSDTLDARNILAVWLGQAGRIDEALGMFEALLTDQVRVLGQDDPGTAATRANLATCRKLRENQEE